MGGITRSNRHKHQCLTSKNQFDGSKHVPMQRPPAYFFILRAVREKMLNRFIMICIEETIEPYCWYHKGTVRLVTYCPTFLNGPDCPIMLLIIQNAYNRLIIKKPVFEDSKRWMPPHFWRSEWIETKHHIVIQKNVIKISRESCFHSKIQHISSCSPSSIGIEQISDVRRLLHLAFCSKA